MDVAGHLDAQVGKDADEGLAEGVGELHVVLFVDLGDITDTLVLDLCLVLVVEKLGDLETVAAMLADFEILGANLDDVRVTSNQTSC